MVFAGQFLEECRFLYNACPPPLDRIVAESMRAQLRVKLCGGPQHTACVLYTTLAIAKTTLTPPTCTHGAQDPSARRFAGRNNNTHPVQLHPYFCFQTCERTGSRSVTGKCRVFRTDVAVAKLSDPKAAVNWTYSPRKCAHLQPQGIDFNDHSSVALGHNRPLFAHQLNVSITSDHHVLGQQFLSQFQVQLGRPHVGTRADSRPCSAKLSASSSGVWGAVLEVRKAVHIAAQFPVHRSFFFAVTPFAHHHRQNHLQV